MRGLYCLYSFISFFLFTACSESIISDQELKGFEQHIFSEIENQNLVGISVACSFKDFNWSAAYGFANLENQIPARINSRYRMASVTKPMTAVAIALLAQRGNINLDDPVQSYVPYFPGKKWPVTLTHLLGHIGGISHYRDYEKECNTTADFSMQESVALFSDWSLLHEPGTKYQYTTYGYNLLGAVIQESSRIPYGQFMQENIWTPLQMHETSLDNLKQIIPNRVRGYKKQDSMIVNCRPVNTSMKMAGGGTVSTVGDMLKFANGLGDLKILNKSWLNKMWTSMVLNDNKETGYGMGWRISKFNDHFKVEHSGSQEGTSTMLMHLPDKKLTVAVASNLESSNVREVANKLIEILLNETLGEN